MKVLCILPVKTSSTKEKPIVQVGETYNVKAVYEDSGEDYYELDEHKGYQYHSRLFAPLSDIDETEMTRDYSRVDGHLCKTLKIKHL